ncbi:hypothetical protein [Microlunatus spumicola]|uniref:hypothetical protein n=1 Tax=Microlunatus spumicola TaxID=81499 RepID=UPI00195CCC7E
MNEVEGDPAEILDMEPCRRQAVDGPKRLPAVLSRERDCVNDSIAHLHCRPPGFLSPGHLISSARASCGLLKAADRLAKRHLKRLI